MLHQPGQQALERPAGMGCNLGRQRSRGHAWLGIHLQNDKLAGLARSIVVAKVDAAHAAAAEGGMRSDRKIECPVVGFGVNRRRHEMDRFALGIFSAIVVEAPVCADFDGADSFASQ